MKVQNLSVGIAGCLLAVALSGCGKNDSNNAAADVKKSAEGATTAIQQGAEKATTEVKQAGEQAVAEVKAAGDKAVAAVAEKAPATSVEATAVISKAQAEVSEKKYQEALTTLASLKDVKLSATQGKVVEELKAQIQKLMTGGAAGAVGNLLGK